MKYLVTAQEMKQYDKNTIEYLGIPGPVLMERAALAAEDFIKERFDAVKERTKVLIFAGMGNNGGDGLALARLLAAGVSEQIPLGTSSASLNPSALFISFTASA